MRQTKAIVLFEAAELGINRLPRRREDKPATTIE
jgi:hypothetical protein